MRSPPRAKTPLQKSKAKAAKRKAPKRPAKRSTKRAKPKTPNKRHRTEPDPLSLRVGQQIKTLRYEHGFSYDAFVGETELGRGYVSELERGLVVPSIQTIDRVAIAFGLTMADLVAGNSVREQVFTESRELDEDELLELLATVRRWLRAKP